MHLSQFNHGDLHMAKLNDKQIENIKKVYLAAREKLLDTIINYQGVGTKTYYNTVLNQLNREIEKLNTETNSYINTEIPKEYQSGMDDVYSYFTKNNLMMSKPSMFANIHMDAVYALSREMQYQIQEGIAQAGRQVLRYLDESKDNVLRAAGLEATAEKIASGSTVMDMKNNLIEKLQSEGFMTVQYGSGKGAYQVSLDAYATMVARSTTREAGNLARENQLVENGYDLVQMSSHYPTCNVCAKFQGRIYSISGKDKRFAPLSQAFASGYRNIHPNCRHVIVPWIESLQNHQEIAQAIIDSNQPFVDSRDQKQIDLYNKQQKQNRQMRQDLYQYERYKQTLGKNVPKSFASFRKIKYNDSENFKSLVQDYKKTNQLNWEKKILNNASKIDDFKAFDDPSQIPKWADKQIDNWSLKEIQALNYYTSHNFSKINSYLRGKVAAEKGIVEKIENISSVIDKSNIEENIVLWRGTSMGNFVQAEWLKSNPVENWIGKVIDDKAFSSTSILASGSFTDKEVYMQILMPANSKGAYINPISEFKDIEYEMLLQQGSSFIIRNAEERSGKKFIQVMLRRKKK